MSALDREIQVMRGFASCRGDEDRINEADEELSSLRAEFAACRGREARMRALIADDGHAMTFQSLGQYRTTLLRALAEGAQG